MRLKNHREDIKDLKLMQSAHVQDIARRYLRLIQMAEEELTWTVGYCEDMKIPLLKTQVRVLKDSQ